MSALALLLLACPIVTDEAFQARIDADDDGVASEAFGGTDCDDNDPRVGAATSGFVDADGDGFGGPTPTTACPGDTGFAETSTDCDDRWKDIGPPESRFVDGDGDGYAASDAEPLTSCTQPGVQATGDCNDSDDTVFPGQAESCLDAVDSDCDGSPNPPDCTVDSFVGLAYGPAVGDTSQAFFGRIAMGGLDYDQDGVGDLTVGGVYSGGVYAFSGAELAAGLERSPAQAVMRYAEDLYPGTALARADVNDDGVQDLLFGKTTTDELGRQPHVGWIELPANGEVATASGRLLTTELDGAFGNSLAVSPDSAARILVGAPAEAESCGYVWMLEPGLPQGRDAEVNAGGRADQTVSGQCAEPNSTYGFGAGVIWLSDADRVVAAASSPNSLLNREYAGTIQLWEPEAGVGDVDLETDEGGAFYSPSGAWFGYTMVAADLDGTGTDELIVGEILASGDFYGSGKVYIFAEAAQATEWVHVDDADTVLEGESRHHPEAPGLFGASLAAAGDMNGDGAADLAAGAPQTYGSGAEQYAGTAYVIPGPLGVGSLPVEDVSWARTGNANALYAGMGLAGVGDLDGDEKDDLAVGMPGWQNDEGEVCGAYAIWLGADL